MTTREKAHELMGHYLTQGGAFGDKLEAADAIDATLAAAVEMAAARDTLRGVMQNASCTLRDLFAAQALQGLYAGQKQDPRDLRANAQLAYQQADAMLAERQETPRAS